jgi:hypothetical protein
MPGQVKTKKINFGESRRRKAYEQHALAHNSQRAGSSQYHPVTGLKTPNIGRANLQIINLKNIDVKMLCKSKKCEEKQTYTEPYPRRQGNFMSDENIILNEEKWSPNFKNGAEGNSSIMVHMF